MADSRKWVRVAFGAFAVVALAAQPYDPQPDLPPAPPLPDAPRVSQPSAPQAPAPVANPPVMIPAPTAPPARRFDLAFDKKADAKDLLPVAPKASARGPVTNDDLKAIPEVTFAAPTPKEQAVDKRVNEAARQIAKINHVNAKKHDAFMATLLANRPDLAGMPFAMGDACRSTGEAVKHFTAAASLVRQAMSGAVQVVTPPPAPQPVPSFRGFSAPQSGVLPVVSFRVQTADAVPELAIVTQPFWKRYVELCDQEDSARGRTDKATAEHITLARVSALTQMLAAEPVETRLGLVKYLTGVPHVESTKALARMAIYSAEVDVRDAALAALKVRREKDYTDILVTGLRYPWPAVARRSAEAITKLERTDLIPQLLTMLEATDPRLPVAREKATSVREMVKLNHHRNCLMCHAPNGTGTPNPNALTAEVAVEGQPLPSPSQGYRQDTAELLIRLDVTYLRQDFSATLTVPDAHPWPEEQRFDFFVRERTLTADEAAEYVAKLTPKEEGVLSPYHKAAVTALRDLTGKDAAPTAAAWRKLLGVPRGE
jgi:hypothetical protein